MGKKSREAYRPSEAHKKMVRTRDGRLVVNRAYSEEARLAAAKKLKANQMLTRDALMDSVSVATEDRDSEVEQQPEAAGEQKGDTQKSDTDKTREDKKPTPDDPARVDDETQELKKVEAEPEAKQEGNAKESNTDETRGNEKPASNDSAGAKADGETQELKKVEAETSENTDSESTSYAEGPEPKPREKPNSNAKAMESPMYDEGEEECEEPVEIDSPIGIDPNMLRGGIGAGIGAGALSGRRGRKARKAKKKRKKAMMGSGNGEDSAASNMIPKSVNDWIDRVFNPWKR